MKQIVLKLFIALMMLMPATTLVTPAYAAACGGSQAAQNVAKGIDETSGASCNASGVNKAITTGVNILSYVVGIAAVVVIIWAGLKYITSGGDANKVANAKSTLLYALVGIAIAALAQLLVHFVLNRTATL